MSKDADKDVLEPEGTEQIRRRRKKSGLRIPSDNVPRNPSVVPFAVQDEGDVASDGLDDFRQSDGIVTPVPEDPNVAVSVAYAFGARGGAQGDDAGEPAGDASAAENDVAEPGGEPDSAPGEERRDTQPAMTTPEVSPEDEASADEVARSAADDDLETRRTRRMPAVQLHELGLSEELLAGVRAGDSIDIPIEEGEPEETPPSIVRPDSQPRAATVALSDDDLEELMEPLDGSAGSAQVQGAKQAPARDRSDQPGSRATQPLAVLEGGADAMAGADAAELQPVAGEIVAGDAAQAAPPRQRPRVPPEPGVPAAVAALEGAGMESPHDTPLDLDDAGDSGELLSDDLIEEVDDSDVEVEADPEQRIAPPPAPPAAGTATRKPPPAPARSSSAKPLDAAKPKRRKGKPWFEEIFDEDYLRTLPFLTPQATQTEAAFVAGTLEVEPGTQLLDVGCGYGRHAMELAARGYHVVALDFSLPLLLRGADEAQRRGLNINFVHGDMRELNFEAQFDGAYCLFSTFGYFDDESNRKTLDGIARALKPGARLVIEVLNRDYLIADLPARVWWEGDGCVVLEEVDFNYFASRIVSNRSVVFDDGRQLEQEISLRAYSLHEFGKLLHGAGFRVLEISGSMATRGRFFGNKSREIIVIAEKHPTREDDRAPSQGPVPRAATASDTGLSSP